MNLGVIKNYWKAIVIIFVLSMLIKPALCFLILGILFSLFGILSITFLVRIYKIGLCAKGKVTEFETDGDNDIMPVIEYTTLIGEIIKEKPYIYTSTDLSNILKNESSINQTIMIIYDPNDPKKFVLKNEEGLNYFVFILFKLSGIFFVGLSICWLLGYIKMK